MVEPNYKDHRKRLRERLLRGDTESTSDVFLLELLLTFAIGRKDVKPLAEDLVRVFGSLSQVLSASTDELYKVKGLGQSGIALLKVVDFIKSNTIPAETVLSLTKERDANQLQLFENSSNEPKRESSFPSSRIKKPTEQIGPSTPQILMDTPSKPLRPSQDSKKTPTAKKSIQRKFQISNGYFLEFDQIARILNVLLEHKSAKKINRRFLKEETGLADRQVESLVSMGAAMGLIKPGNQVLTPVGLLMAKNDIFIEKIGSLEWLHYAGAGSYRNLFWFEVFNDLLTKESVMTQADWQGYFRKLLIGQYSDKTIKKHMPKEIRFIVDAYTKRNFNKLEILNISSDYRVYRRRYTSFAPLVLTAMIYDFGAANEVKLLQVGDMAATPGSPAVVFGLDAASFRQQIEGLHDRGWLRYETTHNLDQIRLKPGFSAMEFLTAHFEAREPREDTNPSPGGIFQ